MVELKEVKIRECKSKVELQQLLFSCGIKWPDGSQVIKDLASSTQCFYINEQGILTVSSYLDRYWNEHPYKTITKQDVIDLCNGKLFYENHHNDGCPLHKVDDWKQPYNNCSFECTDLTGDGIYVNLLLARFLDHKQYALIASGESDSMATIDYCPFCGCKLI